MKLFTCSVCDQLVFFENVKCTACGARLAYLPDLQIMSAIEAVPDAGATVIALAKPAKRARYRLCDNSTRYEVCNWAIPEKSEDRLCMACGLNEVIPDQSHAESKLGWRRLEIAKRRLVYTLVELGLPVEARRKNPRGLGFAFMEDEPGRKVLTGHGDGLITINVAEADDPTREKIRTELGEPYRTLLGHFRHEIGHYYWDRLVANSELIDGFRRLFGDERVDYKQAVAHHYEVGPAQDWPVSFVSAYATMHPWEDWAETFAHYLHIVDTLETARSYSIAVRPKPVGSAPRAPMTTARLHFTDFDDLIGAWFPLTIALNGLNRSMGITDAYPFVLSAPAVTKLRFVHDMIDRAAATARDDSAKGRTRGLPPSAAGKPPLVRVQ